MLNIYKTCCDDTTRTLTLLVLEIMDLEVDRLSIGNLCLFQFIDFVTGVSQLAQGQSRSRHHFIFNEKEK